jgi:TP901 family phage tail tape measure protein
MIDVQVGAVSAEIKANIKPLLTSIDQIEQKCVASVKRIESEYGSVFKKVESIIQQSESRVESTTKAHVSRMNTYVEGFATKYRAAMQTMGTTAKSSADKASKEFQEVTRDLNATATAAKKAKAAVKEVGTAAGGSSRSRGVRVGTEGVKPDTAPLYKEMWTLPYRMEHIGRAMYFSMSRPIQYALGELKSVVVEFEDSLLAVQAILGKTGKEFKKFEQLAVNIAKNSYGKIAEAASVMEVLAKAGMDDSSILIMTESLVNLSIAMDMNANQASSMSIQIANAFNAPASAIEQYTNIMAKGVNAANMQLDDLLSGMSYVAPVASLAGTSIEELTAIFGVLANSGIKGSKAGTTLRNMFTRLLNPTSSMKRVLDEYDISLRNSSGSMKSLVEIIREFEVKGVSLQSIMGSFAQRAGPGMSKLIGEGADSIEALKETIGDAGGYIDELVNVKMSGLTGSMRKIAGAKERIGKALFEKVFEEQLASVAKLLEKVANSIENMDERVVKAIGYTVELGAALGGLAMAAGISARAFKLLKSLVATATAFFSATAGGATAATAATTKTTASTVALGAKMSKTISIMSKLSSSAKGLAQAFSGTIGAFGAGATTLAVFTAFLYRYDMVSKERMDNIAASAKDMSQKMSGSFAGFSKNATTSTKEWWQAFGVITKRALADADENIQDWWNERRGDIDKQKDYESKMLDETEAQLTEYYEAAKKIASDAIDDIKEKYPALTAKSAEAWSIMSGHVSQFASDAWASISDLWVKTSAFFDSLWAKISLTNTRQLLQDAKAGADIFNKLRERNEGTDVPLYALKRPSGSLFDTMKGNVGYPAPKGIEAFNKYAEETKRLVDDTFPYLGMTELEKDLEKLDEAYAEHYAQIKQYAGMDQEFRLKQLDEWKQEELAAIYERGQAVGSGNAGVEKSISRMYDEIYEMTHTDTEVKRREIEKQAADYYAATNDIIGVETWKFHKIKELNEENAKKMMESTAKAVTQTIDLFIEASKNRIDTYYGNLVKYIEEMQEQSEEWYDSATKAEEELHEKTMDNIQEHYNGIIDQIDAAREFRQEQEEMENAWQSIRDAAEDVSDLINQKNQNQYNVAMEKAKELFLYNEAVKESLNKQNEQILELNASVQKELDALDEKRRLAEENYQIAKKEYELKKKEESLREDKSLSDVMDVEGSGQQVKAMLNEFMSIRHPGLQYDRDDPMSEGRIYQALQEFTQRYNLPQTGGSLSSLYEQFTGKQEEKRGETPEEELQKEMEEIAEEEKNALQTFEEKKQEILSETQETLTSLKDDINKRLQDADTNAAIRDADISNKIATANTELDEANERLKKITLEKTIDDHLTFVRGQLATAEEQEKARNQLRQQALDDMDKNTKQIADNTLMALGAGKEVDERAIEDNAINAFLQLDPSEVEDFLDQWLPTWKTYGQTAGEQLVQGMTNAIDDDGALMTAIDNLTNRIINKIKENFDIDSPSKKTEEITKNLLAGHTKPLRVGSADAERTIDQFALYANRMSDAIANNIDNSPTQKSITELFNSAQLTANRMMGGLVQQPSVKETTAQSIYNQQRDMQYKIYVNTSDNMAVNDIERMMRKTRLSAI